MEAGSFSQNYCKYAGWRSVRLKAVLSAAKGLWSRGELRGLLGIPWQTAIRAYSRAEV